MRRLMLRGCSRMGHTLSQALPSGASGAARAACAGALRCSLWQVRQSRARSRSNETTSPRGLAIQARLWNRPTAQPKRQNRCRANANSAAKTAVPTSRKRSWLAVSVPLNRLLQISCGGSR